MMRSRSPFRISSRLQNIGLVVAGVVVLGMVAPSTALAQDAPESEALPPPPPATTPPSDAPPPATPLLTDDDTAPDGAGALFDAKDDPPVADPAGRDPAGRDPNLRDPAGRDPQSRSDREENAALESDYTNCIESDADGHNAQACLRDLATTHPHTEVGQRARMVLDAVVVMRRSGARLVPPDGANAKVPIVDNDGDGTGDLPISFDSVVSRVPATVVGVGYGLALGIGGATSLNAAVPVLSTQGAVLAGGVVSVGAAIGFGTLGFWLSGPDQFRGQGSWLGSGGLLAGAGIGIGLGVAAVDLASNVLDFNSLSQLGPAMVILPGLTGAALGATAGIAAASYFQLDHDQVAVANGLLGYGAMLGGSLAFGITTASGFANVFLFGGLTYAAMVGLAAGASFWVVPNLDFNAGEVFVSTLAMLATSGVMLITSAISASGLQLGYLSQPFIGGTTAVAGTLGFFGTAAILYFLRDETRPLFRAAKQAGITPMITPPTVALDREGKPAFMSPVIGLSF